MRIKVFKGLVIINAWKLGWKAFEQGMNIFKHIMLGHETNFRTVVGA